MKNFLPIGRMISASKSRYATSYPTHVVVFNANLISSTHNKKFWHGDLDLTRDAEQLINLAKQMGEGFYVLREMDARFENEADPKIDRAVAFVNSEEIIFHGK